MHTESNVWALLPELRFPASLPPHLVASALAAHEAALLYLLVEAEDGAPESAAAWLPAAVRRLSGSLIFKNHAVGKKFSDEDEEEEETTSQGGIFELPCFERATSVSLDLGRLGLAVPPAGAFARLTDLSLRRVRFHGSCELGDAVSSRRCPCLQKLSVRHARGLDSITIHSESLLQMNLYHLHELQQLTIVAPALQGLQLVNCFAHSHPVANISAPQLVFLMWKEPYDPTSVQLGDLGQLQWLTTNLFRVYGREDSRMNRAFLWLLQRFPVIHNLQIRLVYPRDIGNYLYLMEDLTVLPRTTVLTLYLHNKGHNFEASLFHILSLCTCLGGLLLVLNNHSSLKEQSACPLGCVCNQPTDWKTEELKLNHLQEVVLIDMKGSESEVAIVNN